MKPKLQLTISQKGVLLVCVPLVFQLILMGAFGWLWNQSKLEAQAASRSREIISETDRLLKSMYFSGSALAAFAMDKSGTMEKNYQASEQAALACYDKLERLVGDDPDELAELKKLKPKMLKMLEILKTARESLDDQMSAFAFVKTHRLTKRIADLIEEMVVIAEDIAARERDKRRDESAARAERNVQLMLAAVVVLDVVLAIGLALLVARGITDRLRLLSENTVRMGKKQELLPRQSGTDEIARLDQSFHDMAEAVAEAERQKQEFVAMIGHDLGTPLTLIYSTMHQLSDGKIDMDEAALRARLRHLEDELARLMGLIRDLLDASKMEAGKFVVHQENVFLWPIIERAVSTIEPAVAEKNLQVVREIDDCEVFADEDRIVQVMINLLGNAAKWAPQDSVIKVAAASADGRVRIAVSDLGPGIPAQDQPLVFERFYQSGTTESKSKGTGLGLAICKAIVQAHAGDIGVTSQPGETTFWFTLPLVTVQEEEHESIAGSGELVADPMYVRNE